MDFTEYTFEGKRTLVSDVAVHPVGLPIQCDGIAWWYRGDSPEPLPEEVRRQFYAEGEFDFAAAICHGATLTDLGPDAIESFRTRWIEKSGNQRLQRLTPEQLLHDCNAITPDGITYAALILFGTSKHSQGTWRNLRLSSNIALKWGQTNSPALQLLTFSLFTRFIRTANLTRPFARLMRLTELGIVKHVGPKKYVLAKGLYAGIGKAGVYTRKVGLDKAANKELLLHHMQDNAERGVPLVELMQVLPGESRGQIQRLLYELRDENRVRSAGKTRGTKWFPDDGKRIISSKLHRASEHDYRSVQTRSRISFTYFTTSLTSFRVILASDRTNRLPPLELPRSLQDLPVP